MFLLLLNKDQHVLLVQRIRCECVGFTAVPIKAPLTESVLQSIDPQTQETKLKAPESEVEDLTPC